MSGQEIRRRLILGSGRNIATCMPDRKFLVCVQLARLAVTLGGRCGIQEEKGVFHV